MSVVWWYNVHVPGRVEEHVPLETVGVGVLAHQVGHLNSPDLTQLAYTHAEYTFVWTLTPQCYWKFNHLFVYLNILK